MSPSPAGPLTSTPVVLLTVQWAGRTWRYSSRPVHVADGSSVYLYRGGLPPMDVYEEAPWLEEVIVPEVQVEVVADTDLAALAGRQHPLEGVTAEVALWREGDDWSHRRVTIQGTALLAAAPQRGQPLRIQILGYDPSRETAVWPRPGHVISADTWTTTGATTTRGYNVGDEGRPYPTVFGPAGLIYVRGLPANVAATPIYPVTVSGGTGIIDASPWGPASAWNGGGSPGSSMALVSVGWVYPGPTTSANRGLIEVLYEDGTASPPTLASATADLWYGTDAQGEVVTLCQLQAGTFSENIRYYACFPNQNGGVANATYSGGLVGAGEIARWALERGGQRVDWRRTAPRLRALDQCRLAGYWDEPLRPWDWLKDNVFPLVPATWVSGPAGLYPVVWRLDTTPERCDYAAIDGVNCTIEGPPERDDGPVGSRWTLTYGYGGLRSSYRRSQTWHGGTTRSTVREGESLWAQRARVRDADYDGDDAREQGEAVETDLVYEDQAADWILGWWARTRSRRPRRVRLVDMHPLRSGAWVPRAEPGDTVAVTSTRYSLSSEVAHVTRAGWLGAVAYVDAMIP